MAPHDQHPPAPAAASGVRRPIAMGPSVSAPLIAIIVGPNPSTDPQTDPETSIETETFHLPFSLLTASSRYFTACLTRPCIEWTTKTVHLDSIKPATFRVYARFLLTGLVFSKGGDPEGREDNGRESILVPELRDGAWGRRCRVEVDVGVKDEDGEDALPGQPELALLLACFKLAGFLEAPGFQDALTDAFVEAVGELQRTYSGVVQRSEGESNPRNTIDSYYFTSPSSSTSHTAPPPPPSSIQSTQPGGRGFFLTPACISFLYVHSAPNSGLRRFIVDWAVLYLDHRGFDPERRVKEEEGEFLRDLHRRVGEFWVGGKEGEGGYWRDLGALGGLWGGDVARVGCEYHGHGDGGCYRKRWFG